jgi:hypothetical protein
VCWFWLFAHIALLRHHIIKKTIVKRTKLGSERVFALVHALWGITGCRAER